MILCLLESYAKQLVLSLCRFDLSAHLLRVKAQVLALVFQMFNLLIIFLFDVHQALKLILIPFQLLLEANNSNILSQFGVLFFRFLLQEL